MLATTSHNAADSPPEATQHSTDLINQLCSDEQQLLLAQTSYLYVDELQRQSVEYGAADDSVTQLLGELKTPAQVQDCTPAALEEEDIAHVPEVKFQQPQTLLSQLPISEGLFQVQYIVTAGQLNGGLRELPTATLPGSSVPATGQAEFELTELEAALRLRNQQPLTPMEVWQLGVAKVETVKFGPNHTGLQDLISKVTVPPMCPKEPLKPVLQNIATRTYELAVKPVAAKDDPSLAFTLSVDRLGLDVYNDWMLALSSVGCGAHQQANILLQCIISAVKQPLYHGMLRVRTASPAKTFVPALDDVERQKLYYIAGYLVSTLQVREISRKKKYNSVNWEYMHALGAAKVGKESPEVPVDASAFQRAIDRGKLCYVPAGVWDFVMQLELIYQKHVGDLKAVHDKSMSDALDELTSSKELQEQFCTLFYQLMNQRVRQLTGNPEVHMEREDRQRFLPALKLVYHDIISLYHKLRARQLRRNISRVVIVHRREDSLRKRLKNAKSHADKCDKITFTNQSLASFAKTLNNDRLHVYLQTVSTMHGNKMFNKLTKEVVLQLCTCYGAVEHGKVGTLTELRKLRKEELDKMACDLVLMQRSNHPDFTNMHKVLGVTVDTAAVTSPVIPAPAQGAEQATLVVVPELATAGAGSAPNSNQPANQRGRGSRRGTGQRAVGQQSGNNGRGRRGRGGRGGRGRAGSLSTAQVTQGQVHQQILATVPPSPQLALFAVQGAGAIAWPHSAAYQQEGMVVPQPNAQLTLAWPRPHACYQPDPTAMHPAAGMSWRAVHDIHVLPHPIPIHWPSHLPANSVAAQLPHNIPPVAPLAQQQPAFQGVGNTYVKATPERMAWAAAARQRTPPAASPSVSRQPQRTRDDVVSEPTMPGPAVRSLAFGMRHGASDV